MLRVSIPCANRFHDEVEGGESVVTLDRTVESADELADLLARGVDLHARCYCGHVTPVRDVAAVELVEERA